MATRGGKTATYRVWVGMRTRCRNPKATAYARYGGVGITVCSEWEGSFAAFLRDMGERPMGMTLDRINPFGNYEASNCRWATYHEQRINERNPALHRARIAAARLGKKYPRGH